MLAPALAQVPRTIRPVASCFGLHQRSVLILDRYFESEVEDDIIPLFRRGEDFNSGIEFMLLVSFLETASEESMEDALASLQRLIGQCSPFIVQATCGCCLNHSENGYNHAAVIRFPTFDDMKLFRESVEYKDMWASKFRPIVKKSLQLHFTVEPVGNQLM